MHQQVRNNIEMSRIVEQGITRDMLQGSVMAWKFLAANKVPGIRAAQAADNYSAERARKSNNAQILALGARTLGPELAKTIVDTWLASEYEGKSDSKVNKLIALDKGAES